MSAVTVQEVVERLSGLGNVKALELIDRIKKHGIAPPDGRTPVAWANGEEIEIKGPCGWEKVDWPSWDVNHQYRIAKPKKRTETRWLWASNQGALSLHLSATPPWTTAIKLEWSATEFEVEE